MKEILLIASLALTAFGFKDATAGNPAVIYGANGLAKIIPANGLEFNGGETLSNTEVGQLKNIMLPFSAVLSDVAIATYFSVGVDQVSATNLDVTKRFEVISTTEASHSCPTMTEIQRDALTPVAGDCIYNSDSLSREFWNGTTWMLTTPNGLPVMAKGSLFASDGTNNGEFTACADGERLEWDSVETSGLKCVPRVLPSYVETANTTFSETSSTLTEHYAFPTVTLETGLYEIGLTGTAGFPGYLRVRDFTSPSGTVQGSFSLYVNGSQRHLASVIMVNTGNGASGVSAQHPCDYVRFLDTIPAGSTTISLRFNVLTGDAFDVSNCKAYYRKLE